MHRLPHERVLDELGVGESFQYLKEEVVVAGDGCAVNWRAEVSGVALVPLQQAVLF